MTMIQKHFDLTIPTSLLEFPQLALRAGVARVMVKAENERPLGNFKVLGGMVAALDILTKAQQKGVKHQPVLVCASAGNHGLAVAAAAKAKDVRAKVFLGHRVDEGRVARIAALGAEIVRVAGTYDDAVAAAQHHCQNHGGLLVADTSNDPNDGVATSVMFGYGRIVDELAVQLPLFDCQPSHVYVQAGVGGLAAAMTTGLHRYAAPKSSLVVVEPLNANCVGLALAAGRPVQLEGQFETAATMLACGLASAPALAILMQSGAIAMTVSEPNLSDAVRQFAAAMGPATTASGVTGLAGLLKAAHSPERHLHGIDAQSSILIILTEGQ